MEVIPPCLREDLALYDTIYISRMTGLETSPEEEKLHHSANDPSGGYGTPTIP